MNVVWGKIQVKKEGWESFGWSKAWIGLSSGTVQILGFSPVVQAKAVFVAITKFQSREIGFCISPLLLSLLCIRCYSIYCRELPKSSYLIPPLSSYTSLQRLNWKPKWNSEIATRPSWFLSKSMTYNTYVRALSFCRPTQTSNWHIKTQTSCQNTFPSHPPRDALSKMSESLVSPPHVHSSTSSTSSPIPL